MTMGEYLLELDWRSPRDPDRDYAGSLTQEWVDFLNEME